MHASARDPEAGGQTLVGATGSVEVLCFSDPGCPWAYSANPALTVMGWRYGRQLHWRLVMIGLTEQPDQYRQRGYTPARNARGYRRFRRLGMPLATAPRPRVMATAQGCRTVVATRLLDPSREWEVYRALQFAWFTTTLLLDETDGLLGALASVPGLDAQAVIGAVDSPEVSRAYEADRARARRAAGSPTEFQGKAAATDGPVRYTAPSLIFSRDGRSLEAGGFQPVEAYDVVVANLAGDLERRVPPEGPGPVLERFPAGLSTQEVAAVLAVGNDVPDRAGAEDALIDLVATGRARRRGLGDDALWQPV